MRICVFFEQKASYEMRISDWSSDVCSSDLGMAGLAAPGRQVVEVARRGELGGLQVQLGRQAADHDGQVIGRAGRGAQRLDLGIEEFQQADRKSVVEGKSVYGCVEPGGAGYIIKKTH